MSHPNNNTPIKHFNKQVQQALNNFHNPTWLGQHSPLATPYFLGQHLLNQPKLNPTNPTTRGQILQNLLTQATAWLAEHHEKGDLYALVLNLKYFQNSPPSLSQRLKTGGIGRTHLYRTLPTAKLHLSQTLIQHLQPALRLERPQSRPLFGRDTEINRIREALWAKKTVALNGPAGIGKTALATHLANSLSITPFWFTIELDLNDHLAALLLALGYYLQQQLATQQKASALFAQVTIDKSTLSTNKAIALLRYDLNQLPQNKHFIFCFDELDLLRPQEIEQHTHLHTFLSHFNSLNQATLLIGQQATLASDIGFNITELSTQAIKQLLEANNINLNENNLTQLENYTHRNPRLLNLFISLHHTGESLAALLNQLAAAPTLQYLINRVWQRLTPTEEELLATLAVFRQPAPADVWLKEDDIKTLQSRHLLQLDQSGGLSLLPIFKQVIYNQLPIDLKQSLHLTAADIRATRGQYTAAAYHFIQASEANLALGLWLEYKQPEIEQGQAQTALTLFESIPTKQLQPNTQEQLTEILADLQKMMGDYNAASQTLKRTINQSPILKALTKRLMGDIAELKGHYEQAIDHYQAGLTEIENLQNQKSIFHKNLSWVYAQQRNWERANHQAHFALYEAENNLGVISMQQSEFETAQTHLQTALKWAKHLNNLEAQAKSYDNLAITLSYQHQFSKAIEYQNQAIAIYQQTGRVNRLAAIKLTQAFTYNMANQPKAALQPATEALNALQQMGEVRGVAIAALNLAEAHLDLENLTKAEHFAQQSYNTEEISVMPHALRVLGLVRLTQGNLDEAQSLLDDVVKQGQQVGDKYIKALGYVGLMQVYLKAKNKEKARFYYKQAIELFTQMGLNAEIEKANALWDNYN